MPLNGNKIRSSGHVRNLGNAAWLTLGNTIFPLSRKVSCDD